MTCTSLCKSPLDGFIYVSALYITKENGLIPGIHYRQILDVFQTLYGYTDFHPAGVPIREVIPVVWTFIDGVEGIREMGLDDLPSPCPGEIGEVALLFSVLVAVY